MAEKLPLAEIEALGSAAKEAAEAAVEESLSVVVEDHRDSPDAKLAATLSGALSEAQAAAKAGRDAVKAAESKLREALGRADLAGADDAERAPFDALANAARLDGRVALLTQGLADAKQRSAATLKAAVQRRLDERAVEVEADRAALADELLAVARSFRERVENVSAAPVVLHGRGPEHFAYRTRQVSKYAEAA